MSSPNLNNLIIVGCILVYVAGVLFGLNKEQASYLCQVNAYKLLICSKYPWGLHFSYGRMQFLFIKILETMISELRILDLVFFVESVNKAMSGDAFLM